MMKRMALLLVCILALLALMVYSKWRSEPPRASGIIEADEIRLGSRVGGRVLRVLVAEGQAVHSGDVLVELEPYDLLERERELALVLASREAEYQLKSAGYRDEEIAQAKAKVDQLQAHFDALQAGPREQEIEAARGRLALAEAEHRLAQRAYQRVLTLARENAASQQAVDDARESQEVAAANRIVRQQELDLLEAGTREEELREAAARLEEARQAWQLMRRGYRAEEIEQAEAARDAARAALAAIEQQKQELSITSPIDGVIEALELQPGDMVAAGAPVLSMLDRDKLWVQAYVPQSRVGMQIGQRVDVTIDGRPGERLPGVISFIARQAEFTPSNVQTPEERSKQVFRIKVSIDDRRDRLRPGMMADVWLDPGGVEP